MPENATVRSRATPSAEVLRVFILTVEQGEVTESRAPNLDRGAGRLGRRVEDLANLRDDRRRVLGRRGVGSEGVAYGKLFQRERAVIQP